MYNIDIEFDIVRKFVERNMLMKKIMDFSPLIIAITIIAILISLFAIGFFDAPDEMLITSSTLTEAIEIAKLTTAKYIQHGIAKAHIEGKEDGYILYYAIVKLNVDFTEITHKIDHEKKTVTVKIPERFTFDVELLEDAEHKFYYYPENKDDWTGKDVRYICEVDAKQKAETNMDLLEKARESLMDTIESLLNPILASSGYELFIEISIR